MVRHRADRGVAERGPRRAGDQRRAAARTLLGRERWMVQVAVVNPAQQGKKRPRGNGNPPAAYRFKPGQSGNPAGRPAAGAAVKEWLNIMQDWTRVQLQAVMEDEK